MSFPMAERVCEHEVVLLDESAFRADRRGVDDFISALKKIQKYPGTRLVCPLRGR
jgi:hypothetical protein